MADPTDAPALSADQTRTLAAALDQVIPPSEDGRLPGAGEVVTSQLVELRAEAAQALRAGLSALDEAARESGAPGYADLAAEERSRAFQHVTEAQPGFPGTLLFLSCTAYYQDPRVVGALGLPARPPHPEGYELETGDLSSLERVKARGRLYREC